MAVLRLIAVVLALAACSAAGADPAPAPPPTMAPAGPEMPRLPSRLDDGTRVRLPPMVVRQDRPAADLRPAYVGAGLIALALAAWWNRRRRERFEGDRPPRPARGGDESDADRDADDLHAAARGDGTDRPDPPTSPSPTGSTAP